MPRVLGRLPFLSRRPAASDHDNQPVRTEPADPDTAPVGPPVLLPASIVRQVLVAATEITPVWAQRRSPEPAETTDKPEPRKRTRRTPASEPKKASRPSTSARRSRRSVGDGTG